MIKHTLSMFVALDLVSSNAGLPSPALLGVAQLALALPGPNSTVLRGASTDPLGLYW